LSATAELLVDFKDVMAQIRHIIVVVLYVLKVVHMVCECDTNVKLGKAVT